jgi:putative DNA primase/helicase
MLREKFDVKSETQGRWRGILIALGLTDKQLSGKNTDCPLCQNGPKSDRFRFDNKDGRGTWICSACGAGDGVNLVEKLRCVDFKGALEILKPLTGSARFEAPKAKSVAREAVCDEMASLWRRARPLTGDCLASRYLASRCIGRASWASLASCMRFVEELPYADDGGPRRYLPCLLSKFVAPDMRSAILHRTWLEEPGIKARVSKPRKMWRGSIPQGGAVRLSTPAETMGVAEGIETALSAEVMSSIPVWACLSAGALVHFQPPHECKFLIIFGDNDASFTGQYSAAGLAHRLSIMPPDKRIAVEIRTPIYCDTGEQADWNDVRRHDALSGQNEGSAP